MVTVFFFPYKVGATVIVNYGRKIIINYHLVHAQHYDTAK